MSARSDAPGDLLFGLLALQTGLIDEARLIAAFHAWTRAKGRAMADLLVEQGALDPEQRSLVEGLVSQHLKKHGGDTEKSLAALPPAPTTREKLREVGDPELTSTLARVAVATPARAAETMAFGLASSDGQRFRPLRPHATGGLGAVFVALDTDLNREVALKEILDRHADDEVSRHRFVLEAEITGKLEHPGIVPVYGFGRHPDGRPYYAMRFIKGDNLKDSIAAFHADAKSERRRGERALELRKYLSRFVDVCDAIGYAHGRGIIHRDIKPSNIIIGQYGETLVVDWGLAKPLGHAEPGAGLGERTLVPSSSSGSAETLPGSALGTPSYMSPEQAAGDLDRIGPRSDVYSLGATLYCLLTGRAPFEGDDLASLLRAVKEGRFDRPREVDPSIDPALEAVCLKAMATRPEERYESAKALGEDIERWAADEPVKAAPEPFLKRAGRWQRRHPSMVYGGLAFLLVTAIGLAITAAVIDVQKRETSKAKLRADESASKAYANFQLAVNTAFTLQSQLADQHLSKIPGMEKVRLSMNDEVARSFDRFLYTAPDDPSLVPVAQRVYRDAGIARMGVGNFVGAKAAYLKALDLANKRFGPEGNLVVDNPTRAEIHLELSRAFSDFGYDAEAASSFEDGIKLLRPMEAEVDPLPASRKQEYMNLNVLQLAGRARLMEGRIASAEGDDARARGLFEEAAKRLKVASEAPNAWIWYALWSAQAHRGLGEFAHRSGDEAGADREFAEAESIVRAIISKDPFDREPRFVLAYGMMVDARRQAGSPSRREKVGRMFDEAVGLMSQIHRESPGLIFVARDTAEIQLERGMWHASAGRDAEAEPDLVEALEEFARLVQVSPLSRSDSGLLGRAEVALGSLRLRQGRADEGRKLIDQGLKRLEAVHETRPKHVETRKWLEDARSVRRLAAG